MQIYLKMTNIGKCLHQYREANKLHFSIISPQKWSAVVMIISVTMVLDE